MNLAFMTIAASTITVNNPASYSTIRRWWKSFHNITIGKMVKRPTRKYWIVPTITSSRGENVRCATALAKMGGAKRMRTNHTQPNPNCCNMGLSLL